MTPTTFLFLIAGLVLLVVGAEFLVRGAASLARSFGISPLVVGLTVVAMGTSSPEIAVSLQSAMSDQANIALGNVIGSNIFNILVIVGISAVIVPLTVNQQLIRLDVPLLIGLSIGVLIMAADGHLLWWEGMLLLVLLVLYTGFLLRRSRQETKAIQEEYAEAFGNGNRREIRRTILNLIFIVGGLLLLVFGARWLVDGATQMARAMGLSELIIGLTIIAVGTSLPEVATSVMAALRKERDIAVGNVIGSNLFNLMLVLGLTTVLARDGVPVAASIVRFDLPVMIAVAIAALPIFFTGNRIDRWEGWLFLGYYVVYALYLILNANGHDALPTFNLAILAFVLPLTTITLLILVVREFRARRRLRSADQKT